MESFGVPDDETISRILAELAEILESRRWTLATAESCTGGWIAKCCTDLAGSSAWFERGFVTYSNLAKQEMLDVLAPSLESDGAVSQAVAVQMAEGAKRRADVQAALAVTGIAGPSGGTVDKPVGTVWFGWAIEGRSPSSELMRFDGDRDSVRRQTVIHSLRGLLSRLHQ